MQVDSLITPGLAQLRAAFLDRGRDIRFVGGVVRTLLTGEKPADFDLCTDASPAEQGAIYEALGIRYLMHGSVHGTLTPILDGTPYEITTLRTETAHDGRWAQMAWTRDWEADLARRDLTINAMAMTFEGVLVDPFGGAADLAAKRVRFVGDPRQRMEEDYLRILRWLRFHGRLAAYEPLDAAATVAVTDITVARGLCGISKERVWSEVQRIISEDGAVPMMQALRDLGLAAMINLFSSKDGALHRLEKAHKVCRDPAALMAAYLGDKSEIRQLAADWKWSAEERDRALFVHHYLDQPAVNAFALVARDGIKREWVASLLAARGDGIMAGQIVQWTPPRFPVTGEDLMALGIKPGPEMGRQLARLREAWCGRGFKDDKASLLKLIP
jgi:tRNA nucleotidyltransferase (CCA-adding enzyme)